MENGIDNERNFLEFGNFFTISITLIIIVILANRYPDISIWNFWEDSYKPSSDLVIMRENYFKTVNAFCLSCGTIYIILFVFNLISMPKIIFEESSLCIT